MTTNLTVRNLEEDLFVLLQRRAARQGDRLDANFQDAFDQALDCTVKGGSKDLLFAMPEAGQDGDFEAR